MSRSITVTIFLILKLPHLVPKGAPSNQLLGDLYDEVLFLFVWFVCFWWSLCLWAPHVHYHLISSLNLELALSLQSPNSSWCGMLLRDHSLGIMDISCYWFVFASRTLVWTRLGNMHLPDLSCMAAFQNNQKSPSWWGFGVVVVKEEL